MGRCSGRHATTVQPTTDDQPSALAVDASGNVVVTGISYNGTNNDFYTAKYAGTNGALLWEQRYNDPANGEDYPAALAVDSHGNVVVTGSSNNGTNTDYYTAKYAAADGALLWEKRGVGGGAVAVDASGNVVVSGRLTVKYRADGTEVWTNNFGGFVAVDGGGNVVVTGGTYNGANTDFYTAKYAAGDGALLWERFYNGPARWQ